MSRVLVVGSINKDIIFNVSNIPIVGETIISNKVESRNGGKGLNQAVALARLGNSVDFVGAVGDDDYGEEIKKLIKNEGINNKNILIKRKMKTGTANILVDNYGNNQIVVYSGANMNLSIQDIDIELIKSCDICLLQLEIPFDTVYEILRLCNNLGKITVLNPAPLVKRFNKEILKYVDFLIPNETELELLLDKKNRSLNEIINSAKEVLDYGTKNVIVTLGDKGCVYANKEMSVHYPCEKVKAVDTTAAGDSFIGGFISAYIDGLSIDECIIYAQKVAEYTVKAVGAVDSLPYKKQLEEEEKC